MKKHLNTLYVTTQNAYLQKEGQSVVVKVENETRLRVPLHTLDGIVCFGAVSMSPFLMHHCAESSVAVSFLSQYGKFLARIQWTALRAELLRLYKPEEDSLRFYFLGKNWESKVEHHGNKETPNLESGALIV